LPTPQEFLRFTLAVYQPEAAIFLSELQVPAYVALVGKARKYEPEDGSVYLSVRPEEINAADETQEGQVGAGYGRKNA